jgi:hypothetical protein
MHQTPVHFPPTTKMIERVEDFFQMSDDWFIIRLSFIVPSPPIGCWIQSYVWPWRCVTLSHSFIPKVKWVVLF